jgi:hypothetical protein
MGMDLVECFLICGCRCGCGLEGCVVANGGWIVVSGKRWITMGKTIGGPVEKAGLRGGFLVDYSGGFDLWWVGVGCGVTCRGFVGWLAVVMVGFGQLRWCWVVGYTVCLLQTKTKIIIIINK